MKVDLLPLKELQAEYETGMICQGPKSEIKCAQVAEEPGLVVGNLILTFS